MRYLSMFSGIDAASVAWGPLGWEAAAFCEIEPFPLAVLAHHYPDVPNLGDVTKADFSGIGPIDLAVFGSPCQSFSIAGKRLGLDDPRGNLALYALGVVERLRPRWFLFENVPGLLSSGDGRDFGAFLGTVGGIGYQCAWRTLDAQYFGVPQRRRRVFVVGYLGDWRRAAAVLLERHSLQGHPPPRREAGQVAPTVPSRSSAGGGLGTDFDCDGGIIAHSLRGEGFDASEDGTGRGTPLVPVAEPIVLMERGRNGSPNLEYRQDGTANAILTPNGGRGGLGVGAVCFSAKDHGADAMEDCSPTLRAGGHANSHASAGVMPATVFNITPSNSNKDYNARQSERSQAITGSAGNKPSARGGDLIVGSAVRRLTPRECERLQGFPDDYTLIPWRGKPASECPDGPRYKALGNSFAVPVVRWLGQRIQAVEEATREVSRAA